MRILKKISSFIQDWSKQKKKIFMLAKLYDGLKKPKVSISDHSQVFPCWPQPFGLACWPSPFGLGCVLVCVCVCTCWPILWPLKENCFWCMLANTLALATTVVCPCCPNVWAIWGFKTQQGVQFGQDPGLGSFLCAVIV